MRTRLARLALRLNAVVDWFIPARLMQSRDMLQGMRMFLFSHLVGPLLGHTISLSMLVINGGHADSSWWILFLALTAFWPFAIVFKLTGWYVPLAMLSIENLMFCIFWGSYQYGGISSPIMPWLVTVPLLAFFYLPERKTRIIVTIQIVVNLALFDAVYSQLGFRESVAPHSLVALGLVSTLCASVYVSMMALYFASIVYSQGELEQEAQRHQDTERKLREATGQAQRALLAKSQFLAKMSHELRNPLNAIIGYSEVLLEEAHDPRAQECKDLSSIRGAGYRLLSLINDLLELARLEAGKVDLRVKQVDIADFFDVLVSRFRPAVAESGCQLVVRPLPPGQIACDPEKVRRIVEGVLSNAVKFTRSGSITLSMALQAESWSVTIEDTGIGIPEARMATLFETFGRSEDETASRYGNEVRLGLPLAYRYCHLMGGQLSVQSRVGVGSVVTVSLPRVSAQPNGAPVARAAVPALAA